MGYEDEGISQDLKSGGLRCEMALKGLYDHLRPKVMKYIIRNRGSHEEAQDVLQDAIVAVYTSILNDKFRGESSVSTFTFAVAKNQWLKRLKRKQIEIKYIESSEDATEVDHLIPSYFNHEKTVAVQQLFSLLGAACEALLIQVYYMNYSMKEIVANSIYENEQVARNKKYKCMKRLKKLLKENVRLVELLRQ